MNNIIRMGGIVVVCMLLFALTAHAATVRVYGTVTDSEGTFISGAKVIFRASDDTVTAVTDTDGRYEAFLTGQPSGVLDGQAPLPFVLSQNYPNPFNPATTIPFSLDRSSRVRLDIYSISGQHVRTLIDEVCNTGEHSVVWDGRDDTGRGVSTGVYLYRLRAGSQTAARKMLLLDGGGVVSAKSQPSAKAAVTENERNFNIYARKGTMHKSFTTSISFTTPETELNIVFDKRYRKHALFLDSIRLFNEFALPGDTLSVVLARVDEALPEGDGSVTLVSQAGDTEVVVVEGNGFYSRNSSDSCTQFTTGDCRKNSIVVVSAPPNPGDGILQVDAVSDTISAWCVPEDTLTWCMPVVATYRTLTMWEMTYLSWGSGEWFVVGENERTGNLMYPDELLVKFAETASESDIESFITGNNLEIQWVSSLIPLMYSLRITTDIHSVDLLEQYKDSNIIEYAHPNFSVCVG